MSNKKQPIYAENLFDKQTQEEIRRNLITLKEVVYRTQLLTKNPYFMMGNITLLIIDDLRDFINFLDEERFNDENYLLFRNEALEIQKKADEIEKYYTKKAFSLRKKQLGLAGANQQKVTVPN